ncbi:carbohydrate esterase family 12 protein [Xylariomycetidae sp. FL2044]|nr:carbohydrate esterase family 12 protein [Xylariomycetidae sp. FL2044]
MYWIRLPALLSLLPVAAQAAEECSSKTPALFLAGDSTTAPDGGWGDGLLATLISPAWGVNIGKSGATTVSFVNGGSWDNVTTHLEEFSVEYDCYVTISFGHNDQKLENNVSFDLYQANLINFANEVKRLGGTPLLTSSLTRRAFPANDDHNATDSLHDQRLAALAAAEATNSSFIDLNAASLEYVNEIGREASWVYNWGDDRSDTTHLNEWGTVVFGRMVADLISRDAKGRCLEERWIEKNVTMSERIWNGLPA